MGEQIRWSVSVDAETDARRKRLHARIFSIIKDNRSRLVQLVFEWAEFSGFTPENVAAMMMHQQGITGAIAEQPIPTFINESQEFPAAITAGVAKPPVRVPSPRSSARRGLGSISRLSADVEMAACRTSFRLNFTRFFGRVA